MDFNEFNNKYVNNLLDNLSKENKATLIGYFNIDSIALTLYLIYIYYI